MIRLFASGRFGRTVLGVLAAAAAAAAAVLPAARGARPATIVPAEGLRDNTPAVHALLNARVVIAPGKAIDGATVVIRDGMIVAVGRGGEVKPPADARVWDLSGRTIYPGLIDAYGELVDVPRPTTAPAAQPAPGQEMLRPSPAPRAPGAAHWNARVTPEFRADRQYVPDAEANRKLRSQGVVARLVAPSRQIVKGTSVAVGTGDADAARSILRPVVAMHLQLRPPGGRGSSSSEERAAYPNSPMGAVALVRQALYDAQWYAAAWAAWEADPSLPRPERSDALEALQPVVSGAAAAALPVFVDAPDEQYALRADRLAREFELNAVVRGSGQEYRRLELIKAAGRPVIVPVNFARPAAVASPEAALAVPLEDLMDWDLQPENAARLDRAGVRVALTSHGLRDKATFLSAVRKAVARGLPPDAALRALTTTPAELLGVGRTLGTIETGKAASLVVTDGDLFAEKTKVLETWVDGRRYEVTPTPKVDPRGTWVVTLGAGDDARAVRVGLTGEPTKLKGKLTPVADPATTPPATGPATKPAATRPVDAELANLAQSAAQLAFTFKGDAFDRPGVVQLSATVDGDAWIGTGVWPDGATFPVSASRAAPYARADEDAKGRQESSVDGDPAAPATQPVAAAGDPGPAPVRPAAPPGERDQPTTRTVVPPTPPDRAEGDAPPPGSPAARAAEKASTRPALFEVCYPLGAFGRDGAAPPEQPAAVLFRNATVWTCGPQGRIERANVLVERGRITAVYVEGDDKAAPGGASGALVIDCTGKHLSPGIIDCHSHIATDGGVNEGTRSITCQVRVGDFIDPSDVNLYRQLAGGVTASNILHGSANTIGGQNQVIKLRWGSSDEQLKFAEAPPGVKFALGENVKQSNWGDRATTRYPQSRMGVEQIVRDAFGAARDYHEAWEAYRRAGDRGVPPRRDLELEALWEIVSGRRTIHCHSYRQDEILALIRTCDSFGVRIGTFQHVLEGYKIADAIAKHGAAGSTFSDWWAYKFEVYDAIPYNGELMRGAGVNVSFNSDDAELARRLNLEAGKAVKYGNVPPEEALKFVTLNPATQLGVDKFVGSIERGKHADLVVWSGEPMSTLGRCEQTWIDGRRYFDREDDQKLRRRDAARKAALVQKILTGGEPTAGADEEAGRRPRDEWDREDVFCGKCNDGTHQRR